MFANTQSLSLCITYTHERVLVYRNILFILLYKILPVQYFPFPFYSYQCIYRLLGLGMLYTLCSHYSVYEHVYVQICCIYTGSIICVYMYVDPCVYVTDMKYGDERLFTGNSRQCTTNIHVITCFSLLSLVSFFVYFHSTKASCLSRRQ